MQCTETFDDRDTKLQQNSTDVVRQRGTVLRPEAPGTAGSTADPVVPPSLTALPLQMDVVAASATASASFSSVLCPCRNGYTDNAPAES